MARLRLKVAVSALIASIATRMGFEPLLAVLRVGFGAYATRFVLRKLGGIPMFARVINVFGRRAVTGD